MQDNSSAARARLVDALKTLRATLARGPEEMLPAPLGYLAVEPAAGKTLGDLLPRADEAQRAMAAVHRAMSSESQADQFLNVSIAPRRTLQDLQRFLLEDVGQLDRLPAPRSILLRLDECIKDFRPKTAKRRRATKPRKPRPLTPRQTEVVQIVGECKGNVAAAARRLGRDRKTVAQNYTAAMAKLGKEVFRSRDKTRLLARDRRGQETVSVEDDRRR
jgi:DNA-binding CsgD family transcriptional regulator